MHKELILIGYAGMTRRTFTLLSTLLLLSSAIAQGGERLRVVVSELDKNGVSSQVARVVSDHLRVKLIETQRFVIPEREKMEAILQEQAVGLTLGECYSQECAIELGRLLQANKMVVGTGSLRNRTYRISLRFLDLESGTAEFSAEEKCQSVDDLFLAAERLAARIVAFVPPRGTVTAVSGSNAIIDIGATDGIMVGMNFRIMRSVERVAGYPEDQLVAIARVTSVQDSWSRLEVDRGDGPVSDPIVRVGDQAIGPQTIAVNELPQYAFLMVYSRPVGAEVYVDNLFHGRTDKGGLEIRLPVGRHTVRLSAPAHKDDERTIELLPSQRLPFNATLQPKLPRRSFNMPITTVSYASHRPADHTFRSELDQSNMTGAQIGFGRIYSIWITEIGGGWAHANMAPGRGFGVNEVHRLYGYGHLGLAARLGMLIPYGGIGYEVTQFMFNEHDVFSGEESIGAAGKIENDGWYVTAGVFLLRRLRVEFRSTWGRPETDMRMFSVGLNLSGF